MKLSELAFACYIYGQMSDYDSSYLHFLEATNHALDLKVAEHRIELLKWLNKWGCRQFAKIYYHLASEEIETWYEEFGWAEWRGSKFGSAPMTKGCGAAFDPRSLPTFGGGGVSKT